MKVSAKSSLSFSAVVRRKGGGGEQKRTWVFFFSPLTQKFHKLFIDSSNILGSQQWKLEI